MKKGIYEIPVREIDALVAGILGLEPEGFSPTSRWDQGGPIIEAQKIELLYYGTEGRPHAWEAQIGVDSHYIDQYPGDSVCGATPLEAAMRALVSDRIRSPDCSWREFEVELP